MIETVPIDKEAESALKAELLATIKRILADRHLHGHHRGDQYEIAQELGLYISNVSLLMQGKLNRFSVGRLIMLLNRLDQDVSVVAAPTPKSRAGKPVMRAWREPEPFNSRSKRNR